MWSPPPWCWMTHDGLCRLRIIFKSASCVKLTCVINTDLVFINYVNGSRYLVVVMFEVIISMVSEALLGMCTCAFKKCGVRRNVCVERLGSVRYIHRTALVNRVKHKKASLQRTERPRANSSELPRPPDGRPVKGQPNARADGRARRARGPGHRNLRGREGVKTGNLSVGRIR